MNASTTYSYTLRDIQCLQGAVKEHPNSMYDALMCFMGTCNKSADETLRFFLPMADRVRNGENILAGFEKMVDHPGVITFTKAP